MWPLVQVCSLNDDPRCRELTAGDDHVLREWGLRFGWMGI